MLNNKHITFSRCTYQAGSFAISQPVGKFFDFFGLQAHCEPISEFRTGNFETNEGTGSLLFVILIFSGQVTKLAGRGWPPVPKVQSFFTLLK